MRIAVYAIAKNESLFVERFLESVRDADVICISDTGSTDDTIQKILDTSHSLGIHEKVRLNSINISPWRFDSARNASLAQVPIEVDICVCLDFDEVIIGDWKNTIIAAWIRNDVTRLRYMYAQSWNSDNTPEVYYVADKIHSRHGYRWEMPVYETLKYDLRYGDEKLYLLDENSFRIHRFSDANKSRDSYLSLLELAVKENCHSSKHVHYYARELYFCKRYEDAIREFRRYLSLESSVCELERSTSYRYIGDCYYALRKYAEAISAYNNAISEYPRGREAYESLAHVYRTLCDWNNVILSCEEGLSISNMNITDIKDTVSELKLLRDMLAEAKSKV